MKKFFVVVGWSLATLMLGLLIAWQFKTPILLGVASFQANQEYKGQQPFYLVPWQIGPGKPELTADQRKPNIILIVADDLGFNDISTFGGGVANGAVTTPNIDALAAQGATFTQSYSGANTCAPSRAMLLTGRYPSRTGFSFTPMPGSMGKLVGMVAKDMDSGLPPSYFDDQLAASKPPYELQGLPSAEITLAETLREAGYYTAHIGKWHLGRSDGMRPNDQGFDDSLLMHSGLYLPEDHADVVNAKLSFDPIDKFLWARMRYAASFNSTASPGFAPDGYITDYYTDESLRVIEANKHRPFFLYLAHWGVHTPLQATREDYLAVGDLKPHRLRVYAAMIRALDRSVGRINRKLQEEGLADNTIVIFTSDNGGPGYLGLDDINHPYRGWKITSFEGGLRVPLFFKWPAKVPSGSKSETPVAHIDVLPTLLSAAGVKANPNVAVDGVNLMPLLDADSQQPWQRETLFWVSGHSQVVRHGDWKLQLNTSPTEGQKIWLYDLSSDPTEQINLADSRPQKLAELLDLLDQYQKNARPPLYPAVVQMPVMVDKSLTERYVQGDELIYTPN